MEEKFILDRKGKKIKIGDVLKIYHFKGSRRKHYMYKQVIGHHSSERLGNYFSVAHFYNPDQSKQFYYLEKDNKQHEEIEIIERDDN